MNSVVDGWLVACMYVTMYRPQFTHRIASHHHTHRPHVPQHPRARGVLGAEDPADALRKRPGAHGVPAQPRAQPRVEEEALHQHGAVQRREDPAVEDEEVVDRGGGGWGVGSGIRGVDARFGGAREEFLFLFV